MKNLETLDTVVKEPISSEDEIVESLGRAIDEVILHL